MRMYTGLVYSVLLVYSLHKYIHSSRDYIQSTYVSSTASSATYDIPVLLIPPTAHDLLSITIYIVATYHGSG